MPIAGARFVGRAFLISSSSELIHQARSVPEGKAADKIESAPCRAWPGGRRSFGRRSFTSSSVSTGRPVCMHKKGCCCCRSVLAFLLTFILFIQSKVAKMETNFPGRGPRPFNCIYIGDCATSRLEQRFICVHVTHFAFAGRQNWSV